MSEFQKTKGMAFNTENTLFKTVECQNLQVVEDFKYIGAWINTSEKDIGKAYKKSNILECTT